MNLFRRLRPLLAGLGLAASACATAPARMPDRPPVRPAPIQPAMWKVSDADTTIYLFGTIHLLPAKLAWQTPAFEAAAAHSDELVVETILDDQHPTAFANRLLALGQQAGLPRMLDRLAPDKRAALATAIAASGFPAAAFDGMKTWLAGFLLVTTQFKHLGLNGQDGVEAILRQRFSAAGKSIGALESNDQQIAIFDQLPEAAQRAFLESTLGDDAAMKAELGAMIDSWEHGDTAKIAATFNAELTGNPELTDALLHRRNADWTRWVKARMARPGTVMVAVGAGHLAGKGSVIDQLKRAGVRIERVQ